MTNGEEYNKQLQDFTHEILQIYYTILKAAITLGLHLTRW